MNYTLSMLKAIAKNNDELELGKLNNLSNKLTNDDWKARLSHRYSAVHFSVF